VQSADLEPRSRLRYFVAGGLLLVLALFLWWMLRSAPPTTARPKPPPEQPRQPQEQALRERDQARSAPGPSDQPTPIEMGPAPVIDEIILEKQEVCEGEENLVTVRAHMPDGTDQWLHYTLGPENGPSVALRRFRDDSGEIQPVSIMVFGKNNVVTTVQVPKYTVKDCTVPRAAYIDYRAMANTISEFELYARIVDVGAKSDPNAQPFIPAKWEWEFGDGETATTTTPLVVHNYDGRSQDTYVTDYLIKVTISDAGGNKIVGRRALELHNPAFENLEYNKVVVLFTEMTPRFPQLDDHGVVTQTARVWHYRPDSVLITNIKVMRYQNGAQDSTIETGNVEQILGTSRIPPGRGIETTLHFDAGRDSKVDYVTYWLEGVSAEGFPVRGNITLMRPPSKPTKDNSQPIMDPVFLAKVKEARRILNQPYVTDEDIWRLEKEGYFKDLQVDYGAVPRTPPPADNLPKPYIPPDPSMELPPGLSAGTPPTRGGAKHPAGH
jgi:hypothetical protein